MSSFLVKDNSCLFSLNSKICSVDQDKTDPYDFGMGGAETAEIHISFLFTLIRNNFLRTLKNHVIK